MHTLSTNTIYKILKKCKCDVIYLPKMLKCQINKIQKKSKSISQHWKIQFAISGQ